MKKSKKVVLLITGSVVLSACQRQATPTPALHQGATGDWNVSPTPTPTPAPPYYGGHGSFWYWFGRGRSAPSEPVDSGARSGSEVSRGGFGAHAAGSGE